MKILTRSITQKSKLMRKGETTLKNRSFTPQRMRTKWLQALALACAVIISLPAHATGERAVKSRVSPVYPELAKRMRITGLVTVEAKVDADGKVLAVKTVTGNRALSQAAEDAVSKWKFVAGPEVSTINIDINFALAQ